MAKNETVTLMDIVRRTGLSKGTVDRVLHNRGEVSRKSYDKVMRAAEELGYKPNVYASLLASPRRIVIAVLLPYQAPDSFWALSASGIDRARESVEGLGGTIVKVEYDQYSMDSFREAMGAVSSRSSGSRGCCGASARAQHCCITSRKLTVASSRMPREMSRLRRPTSRSMHSTRLPSFAREPATAAQRVVLPVPPLPDMKAATCPTANAPF